MDIRFCYRIAAAAGMAHNVDTGQMVDAFAEVKLGEAKTPPANYDEAHRRLAETLARQCGLNPEWFIPISAEEYDREMVDDDDPDMACACGCGMDPCLELRR